MGLLPPAGKGKRRINSTNNMPSTLLPHPCKTPVHFFFSLSVTVGAVVEITPVYGILVTDRRGALFCLILPQEVYDRIEDIIVGHTI